MPSVDRSGTIANYIKKQFLSYSFVDKIQHAVVIASTMILVMIPTVLCQLFARNKYPNKGRLQTVVEGQIYQQVYGVASQSNATIFLSKNKDAILIHTPPDMTPQFLRDIQSLGAPVKYILVSNECHEHFAADCKQAFPLAKLITPRRSKDAVSLSCPVLDGTFEEHLDTLEDEFGFIKMFKEDDVGSCMAERSFLVELNENKKNDAMGSSTSTRKVCLFVARCGVGNMDQRYFGPLGALAGMTGGRFFRMYYWSFTPQKETVASHWMQMVKQSSSSSSSSSMIGTSDDDKDNHDCNFVLCAAVFQHGVPILGTRTKDELLKFYAYQ